MNKFSQSVLLLLLSNVFMNVAWYGHLKFKSSPLLLAILASWGLALFEYCLQVPANRIGAEVLTVTQLKIIQELLSIGTFTVFAWLAFKEKPTANQGIAFLFLVGAAYFGTRK